MVFMVIILRMIKDSQGGQRKLQILTKKILTIEK